MTSLFDALGGEPRVLALAAAWHERVMADDVVSHAFSRGFDPDHTQRLASYWVEALGGPSDYSDRYGDETAVVRIHSGHGPHEEMDQRAIGCFDDAMRDIGITEDDPVRPVLHDYFAWATTATMARYHHSPRRRTRRPRDSEVVVGGSRLRAVGIETSFRDAPMVTGNSFGVRLSSHRWPSVRRSPKGAGCRDRRKEAVVLCR